MRGYDTPNYHALKRQGALLPHTPFLQAEWSGGHTGASYFTDEKDAAFTATVIDHNGPNASIAYRVSDFADNDAYHTAVPEDAGYDYLVQQAASRIYSSGMDALTFVSELPSLRRSISRIAKSARRLLSDRRIQRASSKEILSMWTEGRYGWRTFAFDIRDLHNAVTNFDAERQIYSERAGYSYSDTDSRIVWTGTASNLNWTIRKTYTHTHSVRGNVTGRISPGRFSVNPLVTGWELVQLSFILDWVLDVGTAIEAASFAAFSSEYAASIGSRTVSHVQYHCIGTDSSTHYGNASVFWEYNSTTERRSPSSINFKPQLTNRRLDPEMALDLSAISRLRGRF
jgi:hypothetical protein